MYKHGLRMAVGAECNDDYCSVMMKTWEWLISCPQMNNKGQVSAMKLLQTGENAVKEAKNWTEIYCDYCQQCNWSIRSEKCMGIPAVIMPVLNQFMTKKERLDNLDGVKECCKLFLAKGYLHDDIYWRNIGYFKAKRQTSYHFVGFASNSCF